MLTRLRVQGFKSLHDVDVRLPKFAVLFGPNTAGKSNFLDAVQTLSRIATNRTLSEALMDTGTGQPVRGFPIEAFSLPPNGLPGLLASNRPEFRLEAELEVSKERYAYKLAIGIQPRSGALSVQDECLSSLDRSGTPKGQPRIEKVEDRLYLRRRSSPGAPRKEEVGLNYALISDPRLGGNEYKVIETCRSEFTNWRSYYLDPRVAMRTAKTPAEVTDIGVLGEDIAPFLYRLNAEHPKAFAALNRTVRTIIPTIEEVLIDLDDKRGTLDILIRQDGIAFSSRVVSEGTLRVLALCAIAVNPWHSSLIARSKSPRTAFIRAALN